METTRHFTATTYVVNDGATVLHEHPKLGIHTPPGGHLHRDELPHEAAIREVREEVGLSAALVADDAGVETAAGRSLPEPAHHMLYDVDACDGDVAHQHVDFVCYASVPSRDVAPAGTGEAAADAWTWHTASDLRAGGFDDDVVELGVEAIRTVSAATEEA